MSSKARRKNSSKAQKVPPNASKSCRNKNEEGPKETREKKLEKLEKSDNQGCSRSNKKTTTNTELQSLQALHDLLTRQQSELLEKVAKRERLHRQCLSKAYKQTLEKLEQSPHQGCSRSLDNPNTNAETPEAQLDPLLAERLKELQLVPLQDLVKQFPFKRCDPIRQISDELDYEMRLKKYKELVNSHVEIQALVAEQAVLMGEKLKLLADVKTEVEKRSKIFERLEYAEKQQHERK